MSTPVIATRQLRLQVGARTLVDGLDWHVGAGQCWSIIGRNGAGKSTLLRALAGLRPVDGGSVWRKPRLRVGNMPQKLHVDPTLPLSVLRLVPGVDRAQALAALKEVGAEKVIDSPVQSVSGGEMQRVRCCASLNCWCSTNPCKGWMWRVRPSCTA